MGSAVSSDVIGTMDDASLTSILKEAMKKDPARIDRLFAAARLAIRDEQVAASAAKDDAPPSDEHGGKTLSEEEFAAAVAAELNAVRTNPQSYIPYLEAMLTQFSGNILTIPSEGIRLQTEEGPTAVQDCLVFLKAHQPVDYLVLEPNMSKAAVDHALDLGNNGAVSHTGSDGSTMVGRLEHYGEWKGSIGELLAFGLCRPRNVVLQLLVDDGVPTRGDRMSLMDNKFKSVGVGFHTHKFQKFVCVLDFAGGFGALVDKLTTAKLVHARGEITSDVELVLQSIPFDELKIEVREVLTNAPQKSVSLNYKPGSV
ncbi:hypothetical protein, variant 5 [Aphanomyces astaci]|uniref:SCP domain-containing protein n=2 Tax=Aphanomyces astaci TaxID=112090 RepID=W4FJ12_APHAT|nr:hypothetical protein, variant 5 [Aphanomyces astaci]ETV67475.1 hypothetical protein, variant 5 [Aphanomyces astaci]|eukprot:XP_009843032.1 hypothetical protein, variant 5 [Aphanomyces astaci]